MSHWTQEYQRVPFVDRGRNHSGFDCYGLVRLILIERAGVPENLLPDYADISAFDAVRIASLMNGGAASEIPWVDVSLSEARAFDVLVMRRHGSRHTGHCGIMIDECQVFHIEEMIDAVCVPVTHYTIAPRIVAVRRHRSLCNM